MAQLGLDEAEPVGGLAHAAPSNHDILAELLARMRGGGCEVKETVAVKISVVDPDPQVSAHPDPHQIKIRIRISMKSRIRIRIRVISRTRIRIRVMRIHNTG